MILSMTGYGRSSINLNGSQYAVEIKALNSKTSDIRCKLPSILADKEMQIRKTINDVVLRGRIEFTISLMDESNSEASTINYSLMQKYFQELKKNTQGFNISDSDVFAAVMRIPSVNNSTSETISEDDFHIVENGINEATSQLSGFRMNEGKVLAKDMLDRINEIRKKLEEIIPLENLRISKIRERIQKNLEEFIPVERIDANRFEQEVIYYLEKIDITEEKVRLTQHCNYFEEQLNNKETQVGRILGFIAQEMGREINTLGSKAQESDIQQLVVTMKDELEKIKEQLSNIL